MMNERHKGVLRLSLNLQLLTGKISICYRVRPLSTHNKGRASQNLLFWLLIVIS